MAKSPRVTSSHFSFDPPLSAPRKRSRLTTTKSDHEKLSHPSEFMNNVITDDLLTEILIRIQNPKCLIQYSTVSKRWFSLIFNPQFIPTFSHYHHHHQKSLLKHKNHFYYSQPYTILLQESTVLRERAQNSAARKFYHDHSHQIFSKISKILYKTPASSFLNFLPPGPGSNKVRASFNDLLLVSVDSHSESRILFICNPLTRQWLELPKPPLPIINYQRCGLICEPSTCDKQLGCVNTLKYRLRVVLVNLFDYYYKDNEIHYKFQIFCSETGKWSESTVSLSSKIDNYNGDLVACNGILHWLNGRVFPDFIVAFDPFHGEKQYHLIDLPVEIKRPYTSLEPYMERLHLGVCRGRLRLSLLFNHKNVSFELRVWELSDHYETASSWSLVHKASIDFGEQFVYDLKMLAFHPNNDHVIFLLCNNYLVKKYKILNNELEHVGELQGGKSLSLGELLGLGERLSVFSLLHPPWSTPMPAFQ